MYLRSVLIAVLLLGSGSAVFAQMPYRLGLQTGVTAERSSFRWIGAPGRSLATEDRQHGFFGMIVDFPLTDTWRMEFSPHFGQRNYYIGSLDQSSGRQYALDIGEVDYLALPIILRWIPLPGGIVRPYAAAGVEFGPNLNGTSVTLSQFRYSEEPPFSSRTDRIVSINQLYGAALAEAGLDIQASAVWSVLLGIRYTHEWTSILDDPAYTWEAPHSWKVRFAILYTIDI